MDRKVKRFFYQLDFKSIFFALVGAFIIAFGTYIYADSDIPKGGIIGICLIIENTTGVSLVVSNIVINALCYLFAWRLMGTRYILNAGLSTLSFSVFYTLLEWLDLDFSFIGQYYMLAALIGAVLIETGTGISIRYGSAPDGEHALAVSLEAKGEISSAWFSFILDFSAIMASVIYVKNVYMIIFALIIATVTIPIKEVIVKYPHRKKAANSEDPELKLKKKNWIGIITASLAVIIAVSGVAYYTGSYYRADTAAMSELSYNTSVEKIELAKGVTAYKPTGDVRSGLVFYPGGKVEYTAYEPLLRACAERGILCISVQMPLNLAIFGINKAVDVIDYYPEIEHWYIGGHSLGGSMASICASANEDKFDGVMLLAAYSTIEIDSMPVLSVYGSRDGVLNMTKYNKYKSNISANLTERIISGGSHAYFGMYGKQKGDGEALITNSEQINATVGYIAEFILK